MLDQLIELLETFGYPVRKQGSFNDADHYPDSFFTFWNDDSPDHAHYDNKAYGTEWSYDINFYSTDPSLTETVLAAARIRLKQNGWVVPSRGFDVRCDEPTHTARGIVALYLDVPHRE